MATRKKTIIAVALAALCLMLLVAALGARRFVRSGGLKKLIETRAAQSLNANVEMKSLRLSWPWRVEIEELEVSAPGREDSPFLTCPKLTITAPIWDLLQKHVSSVVLVGPKIDVMTGDGRGSNIPRFPKGEASGAGISIGIMKVIDADVSLDSPSAKADVKGILATLSTRRSLSGPEKIIKLNIDAAEVSIGRDDRKQVPLALKLLQSKFVIRDKPSGSEIEAEIKTALSTELPHLLLPPDLPVTLAFEFDYLPQRDSLENGIFSIEIDQLIRARICGSVESLTGGTPVANLSLTVPALDFESIDEYIELLQRPSYEGMKLAASLRISGEMKGSITDPELSARVNAEQGRFEWKGFTVEGIDMEIPLALAAGDIAIGPGRVSATRALASIGEEAFEMTSLAGRVSGDSSRVSVSDFAGKLGDAAELSLEGTHEFDSGRFHGSARMEAASLGDLLAYASPVARKLPEDFSASGRLGLDIEVDAGVGSKLEELDAKYRATLGKGGATYGELIAAEGIAANLAGSVETESPGKLWKFDVGGNVGNFEILVDTFYKDFSAANFPISFSGEYEVETRRIRNAAASADLGAIGKIAAGGDMQFAPAPEIDVYLESEGIDLEKFFDEIGRELVSESAPVLHEAGIGGIASGGLTLRARGDKLQADGTLRLTDGRIALAGGAFAADSVSAKLPFDVRFPQDETAGPVGFGAGDYGKIRLGNMRIGPVEISSLDLDVALKENAISIKDPAPLDIFGGTIDVGAVEGENIFGPSATLKTSLVARDISLGKASRKMGLPEVAGTLNADFDRITLTRDLLTAEGTARASAFGGAVDMASLRIDNPYSSVRTIRTDLEFKEIDLSTLTQVLDFGSISGVMEGTLRGLEISQGQPAAFDADFQTVKRRGVRRRINFDAVENITILGTGQGFQAGLGRGLATFFEEFGYDTIGFQCTLKNDKFKMKGKVIRGDTEYFVKGVTLGPQINVINRNPGQTVSFKSMLERINRIKTKEESDSE